MDDCIEHYADRLYFSLGLDSYETQLMAFRSKKASDEIRDKDLEWMEADINV